MKMPNLKKLTLKRRWIKARPGSVLILVIALLVLLALIGTAYLSSTQTERYTSRQNTINTEADLLMQGMVNMVSSEIVSGLYGNVATTSSGGASSIGTQSLYRAPSSEMPYVNPLSAAAASTTPTTGLYYGYDSAVCNPKATAGSPTPADLWLGDRVPIPNPNPVANMPAAWNKISWPLFTDSSGYYTFDSPLIPTTAGSIHTGTAINKADIYAIPTSTTLPDGSTGPALMFEGGQIVANTDGTTFTTGQPIYAASAAGDGIADSAFVKVPVGQVDGITYYVATRIVDGNSAINASSAMTQGNDNDYGTPTPNYGFFRSNIGLNELLSPPPAITSPSPSSEMNALNSYRFGEAVQLPLSGLASPPFPSATPARDNPPAAAPPNSFLWYSWGDEMENQLTRRPGNTGYDGNNQMQWLGMPATAALAYKFSLTSPYTTASALEQLLPNELLNSPSIPYSASQVTQWYNSLFLGLNNYNGSGTSAGPLRTVLVGSNPVSNAAPTRLGNSSSPSVVAWAPNTSYNFGDWVTDGTPPRSYVCIQSHTSSALNAASSNEPGNGVNLSAVGIWAGVYPATPTAPVVPGFPFSSQVTKTSINTATFEQLWLGFAQVMTDSVAPDPLNNASGANVSTVNEWQPPMQQPAPATAGSEPQLGMFRSVIRSPSGAGRLILTSSQMLKLRAALAAVNTMDLRDSDDDVTSRRIILTDDSTGVPLPKWDVEVYGTEKQPYISELVLQNDGTPTAPLTKGNNYIAVELCNPYPVPLILNGWKIASVSRAAYSSASPTLTLTAGVTIPLGKTIPPAVNGVPGLLILYDGTIPNDIGTPTSPVGSTIYTNSHKFLTANTTAPVQLTGLFTAACTGQLYNEIVLLRPRRYDGSPSSTPTVQVNSATGGYQDSYLESSYLADMVPADQMDLTGLAVPPPPTGSTAHPYRFLYRRSNWSAVSASGGSGVTLGGGPGGGGTPGSFPLPGQPAFPGCAWQFVYPGYYNLAGAANQGRYFSGFPAGVAESGNPTAFIAAQPPFTLNSTYPAIVTDTTASQPCGLAGPTGYTGGRLPNPVSDQAPTYTTVPIQLNNEYMAGPNPVGTMVGLTGLLQPVPLVKYLHPFGHFARQVDMLQIPFIGAYRIRPLTPGGASATDPDANSNNFTELNSVTMDSALANDSSTTPTDLTHGDSPSPATNFGPNADEGTTTTSLPPQFNEQIGRFCPIGDPAQADPTKALDFGPGYATGGNAQQKTYWHYHWARRLFDYFTVQSPQDDYYPNVDPAQADPTVRENGLTSVYAKYPDISGTTTPPVPIGNNTSTVANNQTPGLSEDTLGVEGLININTAPVAVLAQLPFYTAIGTAAGQSSELIAEENAAFAQAIVAYRNANGPFQSIMDLYKVSTWQTTYNTQLNPNSTAPGPLQGVFSPFGIGAAGLVAYGNATTAPNVPGTARYDFQERFLLLNNISNLITTRSDTFTCYILLQGWRNVGTSTPTLAVQRRAAFILDRTSITPSNSSPIIYKVPTE